MRATDVSLFMRHRASAWARTGSGAGGQRRWDGFDGTILALYARGMSTRDVQSFLREKYDIEVSPEFISSVCESVSAGVQEWRTRPLQAVWPILYLDALFLKVRDEGRVVK